MKPRRINLFRLTRLDETLDREVPKWENYSSVTRFTPTGSMPILLPEEVKGNRSTRVVNRVTDE